MDKTRGNKMVSFKELTKELPPENLLIVDSMNLAFRWKHRGSSVFADEYIRTVESLARSYECGTIAIAADWGGSSYRKAIFPEYKANRKELYANQTPEEEEEAKKFFEELGNTLEKLEEKGYPVFRYKGVEADDIAAYLVDNRETYMFEKIWLISSDRDWDLLINENVSRFSYVTRKEQTLDNWDNDVSIEEYISLKCLMGDKGDNIPGIKGIGPKRAKDLIDSYGDALEIYASCPLPGKYVYISNLNEQSEQILINYQLMDLLQTYKEAVGQANIADIHKRMISL